ncbi:MAG: S-layer homology domain-containing protein [Clostridia bacterium]|nr:S-layer homology domain-containing protein [Clostridia bacterium]
MKKLLTILLAGSIIFASISAYALTDSSPIVEFAALYEYDKSDINIITVPKEFSEVQKSKIIVNGLICDYSTQCFTESGILFANPDIFKEFGCNIIKDSELNVITIEKNDIVLEISPNLSAMRKNKENGYWISLTAPAGIYEEDIYVPVGEIAKELGLVLSISANYNGDTLIYNLEKFIFTPQIALTELKKYGVFTEISHYDFDAVVTRSEACFLLDKIFYHKESSDTKLPFTDIEASSGLYNALTNLVSRNIVNGYADKTFRPKDIVTIEQYAAMLIRAAGHSDFDNNNESPWYLQIMQVAKHNGIMENTEYEENTGLTYGQAIIMLYNTVNTPISYSNEADSKSTLLINFVKDKYNALLKNLGA